VAEVRIALDAAQADLTGRELNIWRLRARHAARAAVVDVGQQVRLAAVRAVGVAVGESRRARNRRALTGDARAGRVCSCRTHVAARAAVVRARVRVDARVVAVGLTGAADDGAAVRAGKAGVAGALAGR